MARKPRASISVSRKSYDEITKRAERLGVPRSALIELVIAHEIGTPFEVLDEDVRKYASAVFPSTAAK